MYVIWNLDNHKYMSILGIQKSYTKDIEKVAVFTSIEKADKNKCENEIVLRLHDVVTLIS
jgi:hypothetical protein